MSRRLQQTYRCEPLRELARQLLFAPPNRRLIQVQRAERLHDEIDPARTYPLEFLVFRLTGYRPETNDDALLLVGEAVQPDLRLLIDQLSRSIDLPPDPNDPAETIDQLAARLNVNRKTIARWRQAGLRWRWVIVEPGARPQIVIPCSALTHFQARHGDRVKRASQFTQIDPATRQAILRRARRLAEAGDFSFNEVATHLARRTSRAVETIRLALAKHDREHPDDPIFADRTGPLTARQRRLIARAHRLGVPVRRLAQRFRRTRATIYRVIHQHQAAEAQRVPLTYIASPMFKREDAEAVILRPAPTLTQAPAEPAQAPRVPVDDLPEALQACFSHPPLPSVQERSLFIRYNFLKYAAARCRESWNPHDPKGRELEAFRRYICEAERCQAILRRSYRPILLSVARRQLLSEPQASPARLLELVVSGHTVLVEAVEQFNATRNATFESYLTNRLLQHFAADQQGTLRARRRRSVDELLPMVLEMIGESDTPPPA